ncbi:MAG: hypothetical protein AAFR55_01755 [Pseudomonadota bacterium]
MIAHVARSDERRGRVVLRVAHRIDDASVDAAAFLASAYGAELEALVVEDARLYACTALTFVEELTVGGTARRRLAKPTVDIDFAVLRARVRAALAHAETTHAVTAHHYVTRDDPMRAISVACARIGPWNIIALPDPSGPDTYDDVADLMERIRDMTGVLLSPPRPIVRGETVVAVVDRADDLAGSVRTAQRLAAARTAQVVLMIAAATHEATQQLEDEVRIALGSDRPGYEDIRIARPGTLHGEPDAILHALAQLQPAFAITRFGGPLTRDRDAFTSLGRYLPCPILIGRGA